jgi:hypothetical protein
VDEHTPTTIIREGRHPALPHWAADLLILAIVILFLACITFGVSVLPLRSHNPSRSTLNDGMATLAFFLNGAPLTRPN